MDNDCVPFVGVCGGCILVIGVLICQFCLGRLEPNSYGLARNFATGVIDTEVYRGGIHLIGPFKGFIPFPAAQLTLQWSKQMGSDRGPISARTGQDPRDPDSGGQVVTISCALQYQFQAHTLTEVFLRHINYDTAKQRYLTFAGNMVGNVAQDFVPTDFWTQREVIAAKMLHEINQTLWKQGFVVATRFEILRVDFAPQYENTIISIQVAEQAKVVNEYEQQVQEVVQEINVLMSHNNAAIANITGAAVAHGKEICAAAKRDAFAIKQGMKAKKYAELQEDLGFGFDEMEEFFRIHTLQSTAKQVVGLPGFEDDPESGYVASQRGAGEGGEGRSLSSVSATGWV